MRLICLTVAALLAAATAPSRADQDTQAPPAETKKGLAVAAKEAARAAPASARPAERARWAKELKRRVGKKPAQVVNIYNTWTHEMLVLDVGAKALPPPDVINNFLRCHFTNHVKPMDERLFGVLRDAAAHFKVTRIDIISGFRAPKYNLVLRKKGRNVARNSQHTVGHAVDFRLEGVTTERLRDWARRLGLGGVGYYANDGFVHVDVGPVRYWAEGAN